jgi:hypothetical protein
MGSTVTGALATAAVVLILLAGHLDRGSCRRRRPSRGVLMAFDTARIGDLPSGHAPPHHGPSDGSSSWSGSDGGSGSSS